MGKPEIYKLALLSFNILGITPEEYYQKLQSPGKRQKVNEEVTAAKIALDKAKRNPKKFIDWERENREIDASMKEIQ